MTKGTTLKFLKGAGAAGAMAVALTSLAATPAMADNDRRGGEARSDSAPRGNRGAPQQAQQPRPQMRAPQAQQQPQPRAQGGGQRMPDWAPASRGQNQGQSQAQASRPDVGRPAQGSNGNAWRGQGQPSRTPAPSRTPDWARNLGNNRPGNDAGPNRPSDNQSGRPSWQGGRDGPDRGPDRGSDRGPDRGPDRGTDRGPDRDGPNRGNDRDRNPSWKGGQGGNRGWNNDDRRWDRSDWRRDNRYDWRSYRDNHRSVYRGRPYYAPYRGYSYRRLSIGFYMSSMFYGSSYWLDDPWMYRLPPVYGPYRWVRYYDDVMLVDVYSGEVVDVIYDFFW